MERNKKYNVFLLTKTLLNQTYLLPLCANISTIVAIDIICIGTDEDIITILLVYEMK